MLCVGLFGSLAQAHPHVFIKTSMTAVVDEPGLKHLMVEWKFDPGFSHMFLHDCDKNKNKRIDSDEFPAVQEHYSNYYREQDFFIILLKNEEPVDSINAKLDHVEICGDRAIFHIKVVLDIPFAKKGQDVYLQTQDPTHFIYFSIDRNRPPKIKSLNPIAAGGVKVDAYEGDQVYAIHLGPGKPKAPSPTGPPSMWDRYFKLQAKLNATMSEFIVQTKKTMTPGVLAILFLAAAGYGFVHAAAPGHGKSLAVAFFLNRPAHWYTGPVFGFLVAAVHTCSAILLSTLFMTILSPYKGTERMMLLAQLNIVIAMMILLLGVGLLVAAVCRIRRHTNPDTATQGLLGKSMFGVILLAGMIPCPLSITIMLMAVSLQAYWLGLFTVIGVSLGTAALLSLVSVLVIKGRAGLFARGDKNSATAVRLNNITSFAGALLIILLGVGLCVLYSPISGWLAK